MEGQTGGGRMTNLKILGTEPIGRRWVDRVGPSDWYHWSRYESCLRANPTWKPHQVESVAAESLRILRRMPDPRSPEGFQGRGLVVGYVQSGKTANYTAVAARAADAGYRIVIVLSGVHDSLRTQTQNRLEQELTGHQPGMVGEAARGQRWITLTAPDADFTGAEDPRLLQTTAPVLIVAKKLVPILRRLDHWIENAGDLLSDKPLLLIDDEADQASINTRGNRDPSVSDGNDPSDDDSAPTGTNALIRSILGRVSRAAYVAYTATPFANILIDPDALDREVGQDLFPRDFVVQLPRPDGYTGTEELFGTSAADRDVLRPVSPDDLRLLRGPAKRRRKTAAVVLEQTGLPASLIEAIHSFMVVGGIRHLRGQTGKPNTMLVHVSQLRADQGRIADQVEGYLRTLRDGDAAGTDIGSRLLTAWRALRPGVVDPPADADVIATALAVMRTVDVALLNSDSGEELDYERRKDRQVIAVGGNRLSRGLTLQGLTISYFLRTTSMCDTLLQMARWYGFRNGYDDLIRIWTTDGIARWFAELAIVEQSLRDAIIALDKAGKRPDQMAIRLRAHSELLLTSKAKSRTAEHVSDSWSGEHPQTTLLPLSDERALQHNRQLVETTFSGLASASPEHGGRIIHDVTAETVVAFLQGYVVHPEVVTFDPKRLAEWIAGRSAAEELTDQSVLIVDSGKAAHGATVAGVEVGLVKRRPIHSSGIGILIDPRHEGVDLPGGPDAFKGAGGNYDADAMRAARPVSRGLLLVYPLDPELLGVTSTDAVIALALSLPRTTDAGGDWIVNRGLIDAHG